VAPGPVSIRWAALISLLVAEAIGLGLRFDGATAAGKLPELLIRLPGIAFQCLVVVASVVYLGRMGRAARASALAALPREVSPLSWRAAVVHIGALAAFTWLTAVVLEGGSRALLAATGWATAWAAMGLATLLSWLSIGLPPRRWLPAFRRGEGLLLAGAAVGLATWGTGRAAETLWHPLGRSTLWAAYRLLRLVSGTAECDPESFRIGTATFEVTIAPTCSGYQGLGLILALVVSYLWIARQRLRFPNALILIPLGLCVIWLANALRIAGLVALGSWGFGAVALGGFHSQAGWLAFEAVGLGLIVVADRWSFVRDGPPPLESDGEPCTSTASLGPFLALVATAMITGAFSTGVDLLYPLRILAAVGVLWICRRSYGELRWPSSLWPVAIGVAAFAIWMALEPFAAARGSVRPGPMVGTDGALRGWVLAWLAFRVVGSVVVVSVVEELAFRSYLTRRLISPRYWTVPPGTFTWSSFLISSALFGLLHTRWLAGTLAGMLYAWAYYRRRELSDAVLAHATTNALIAAGVLDTGDWTLWG
jgi:exosortase E/protease (VPEID-CTERM system)